MTATAAPAPVPLAARPLAIAAAVSLGLIWTVNSWELLSPYYGPGISAVPYLGSALTSLSDLVVMTGLAILASGRGPAAVLGLTGLFAPIQRPLLWAALLFVPAVVVCLMVTRLAEGLKAQDLLWTSLGGPIFEEVVFRGLAVGLLIRWAGWHWLAACLWPAVFFGAAHLWQGSEPMEILGIVAITGLGGVIFGWLYWRWDFNLWPAIFAHIGLNALWSLFDLGDTALGGAFGNILRFSIIGVGILLTLRLAPPRPRRGSDSRPAAA